MYSKKYSFLLLLVLSFTAKAQTLTAGFDAREYLDMLRISAQHIENTAYKSKFAAPENYHRIYQSSETPLKNRWDLWLNDSKSTMVISIRGTTAEAPSWLENFYSAMIPATGTLQLNDSTVFNYKFSADTKASVHVGWTIGLAGMLPEMVQKIKALHEAGTRQVIIMGHSQGGALAYLLTSYLYYQVQDKQLPADLSIKTYCSAAPKPGNLYYAYDFDYITRNGRAFTIVNAADWVPETPFTAQTVTDFNPLNPFININDLLRKQKFFVKLYLRHVYNKLRNGGNTAQNRYEKYLGKTLYLRVKKYMPQLKQPTYAPTANYMRAGVPIVLQPDADYYKTYPDTSKNIFIHHAFEPYYELTEKIYLGKH